MIDFLKNMLVNLFQGMDEDFRNFSEPLFQKVLDQKFHLAIYNITIIRHFYEKSKTLKTGNHIPKDLTELILRLIRKISKQIIEFQRNNQAEYKLNRFAIFTFFFLNLLSDYDYNLSGDLVAEFLNNFSSFLKTNLECKAIIISILHVLLKLNRAKFVDYLIMGGKPLIEHLLETLNHPDTANQEFISIVKFLTELVKVKNLKK